MLRLLRYLSRLQRHLDVAAFDGKVEARAFVFDKVQGHLREALLLEVGNDGLAAQSAAANHRQHLVKFALHQRQLEDELRRVHLRQPGLSEQHSLAAFNPRHHFPFKSKGLRRTKEAFKLQPVS